MPRDQHRSSLLRLQVRAFLASARFEQYGKSSPVCSPLNCFGCLQICTYKQGRFLRLRARQALTSLVLLVKQLWLSNVSVLQPAHARTQRSEARQQSRPSVPKRRRHNANNPQRPNRPAGGQIPPHYPVSLQIPASGNFEPTSLPVAVELAKDQGRAYDGREILFPKDLLECLEGYSIPYWLIEPACLVLL